MNVPVCLDTERLYLRPPHMSDIPEMVTLLEEPDISSMTATIPHPYTPEDGRHWIELTEMAWRENKGTPFAIIERASEALVGSVGLGGKMAEPVLGYWIGKPFWSRGYATEASQAVIDFAFRLRGIGVIQAWHRVDNPASGRVLEKCGFTCNGDGLTKTMLQGEVATRSYRLERADWEVGA